MNRWFRYPAGLSDSALRAALAELELTQESITVDPFVGAASAGTAIVPSGGVFYGMDAHPLVAELASLKFVRWGKPEGLADAGEEVASAPPAEARSEHELVRRSFSASTLQILVGMREAIARAPADWRCHLKWALLGTLRDAASIRAGWPYQLPGKPRQPIVKDARARFRQRIAQMVDDIKAAAIWRGSARIVSGDARTPEAWDRLLGGVEPTACLSSPPYLNNFDYADATRLELYFWREIGSWRELTQVVRSGMVAGSTQQTTVGGATTALKWLASFPDTSRAVRELREELGVQRRDRPRGKEYDNLVAMYFADVGQVLVQLHARLAPRSPTAWVVGDSAPYGVYVDTPALLSGLATEIGFEPIDDRVIRRRGVRWTSNGTRHQRALSERLIVLRRSA